MFVVSSTETLGWDQLIFRAHLFEYYAVRFEDPFELLNNFVTPTN